MADQASGPYLGDVVSSAAGRHAPGSGTQGETRSHDERAEVHGGPTRCDVGTWIGADRCRDEATGRPPRTATAGGNGGLEPVGIDLHCNRRRHAVLTDGIVEIHCRWCSSKVHKRVYHRWDLVSGDRVDDRVEPMFDDPTSLSGTRHKTEPESRL